VVPKHGRRIVDRNRLRRRIREIGRTRLLPHLAATGQALDVLIRARREAYDASFDELRRELVELVEATWPGAC
jgi:ribonuclease P protein component